MKHFGQSGGGTDTAEVQALIDNTLAADNTKDTTQALDVKEDIPPHAEAGDERKIYFITTPLAEKGGWSRDTDGSLFQRWSIGGGGGASTTDRTIPTYATIAEVPAQEQGFVSDGSGGWKLHTTYPV